MVIPALNKSINKPKEYPSEDDANDHEENIEIKLSK